LEFDFSGIAKTPSMKHLLQQAQIYAPINRPILIRGERGTGKELIAKFIHESSDRKNKPFVAINCAAMTEQLLTSEIYGHEKGAFTGADTSRIGKLEQADGGTLFFDEIGNMSLSFQQKIIRVVEYQEFEKVRGTEKIKVDVRILSATNADLEEMMDEKLFMRDLYDRLTFAEIRIPPLRERREDIPSMIVQFVQNLHEEIPNLLNKKFKKEVVNSLMDYHWPGNIRELKNFVERIYLGPADQEITLEDLPLEMGGEKVIESKLNFSGTFDEQVDLFKEQLIQNALLESNGKQKLASDILGMTYDQFRHYFKKFK